ncbi:MAG: ATP-binding protein [Halolamina sp.]
MIELGSDKKLSGTVPFPAVVGQAELKEAALAVAAADGLDGLLVRGEKGTGKSTTVRAVAELLPAQRAVADCRFGCPPDDPARQCTACRERTDPPVERRPVPFVTLPLGASRERVVGSLSVADALDGDAEFNPGLLARANRGVLYVDEVNLLDDHLVDVLLDAAASGVNRVERDGVSVAHPAQFTLVGTMNPEEGDLRPQFRDRFDLQVAVAGSDDLDERATVVERSLAGFDGDYAAETDAAAERLRAARELLPEVDLPGDLLEEAVELCRDAGVEGYRADVATARAARALAALDGRPTVVESDVRRAAEFALPHRLRSTPFEDAPDADELLDDHFGDGDASDADDGDEEARGDDADGDSGDDRGGDADDAGGEADAERGEGVESDAETDGDGDEAGTGDETDGDADDATGPTPSRPEGDGRPDEADAGADESRDSDGSGSAGAGDRDDAADAEAPPLVPGQSRGDGGVADASAPAVDAEAEATPTPGGGRAGADIGDDGTGVRVRTESAERGGKIDAAASVRAAATRGADAVAERDLRRSVRTGDRSTLVVFAVDASASMRPAMRAARGVALDLLREAYEARDEVAVVTFAGDDADVVLPPTDSVDRAARHLKALPTGDRTPLPAGLAAAGEVLDRADPEAAVVVLVTDGRGNAGTDAPVADARTAAAGLEARGASTLVVDAGDEGRGVVDVVVEAAAAERVPLSALTADRIASAAADAEGEE